MGKMRERRQAGDDPLVQCRSAALSNSQSPHECVSAWREGRWNKFVVLVPVLSVECAAFRPAQIAAERTAASGGEQTHQRVLPLNRLDVEKVMDGALLWGPHFQL